MQSLPPMIPVAVAPMEGVTNFPMRLWMHLASAPAALATPFLRVTATFPHGGRLPPGFAPELDDLRGEVPYTLVPQMMAVEADDFVRTAELFLGAVPFVELNAGCPSPTCTGKGAGSSLLREADGFHAMVGELAAALGPERVAVKMRTGYADERELPRLLAGIAGVPLARLTMHGRTRPAGYTGEARWDLIEETARTCRAPVYASGDVVDLASLTARLARAPGVRGVLVGRGALRNPWVFTELRSGRRPTLPAAALLRAVASYALLHELHAERYTDLLALVRDGLVAEPCGTDPAAWDRVYRRTAAALALPAPDLDRDPLEGVFVLGRNTLGRAKMVWNYLRSSLPPAFFEPLVLRSKDLGALLAHVRALVPAADAPADALPLAHAPGLDWLYAGSRREAPPQPATGTTSVGTA